jgi:hypothetical protein
MEGLNYLKLFNNVRRQTLTRFYYTDRNRIPPANTDLYFKYMKSCEDQYGLNLWHDMLNSLSEEENSFGYFTPKKLTDKYGIENIRDNPIQFYEFDYNYPRR